MARNNVDNCIICNCLPCECLGKPKTKKAGSTGRSVRPVLPVRTVSPALLVAPPSNLGKQRPDLSKVKSIKSQDELETERAITVLAAAGLLHFSELEKYRGVIHLPAYRIDALIWRQRAHH